MINLYSLGLTESQIKSGPKDAVFPPRLNKAASKHWPAAVGTVSTNNPKKGWTQAITRFIKLAAEAGDYAFTNETSVNDRILTRLIYNRRQVVKFIDRNNVLDYLRTRNSKREVIVDRNGFSITVEAKCNQLTEDPTFIDVLGLGIRRPNGRWQQRLGPDVDIYLYNEGARMSQRWVLGYTIRVREYPVVPNMPAATTLELERFILENMYLPILKSNRPLKGIRNLF